MLYAAVSRECLGSATWKDTLEPGAELETESFRIEIKEEIGATPEAAPAIAQVVKVARRASNHSRSSLPSLHPQSTLLPAPKRRKVEETVDIVSSGRSSSGPNQLESAEALRLTPFRLSAPSSLELQAELMSLLSSFPSGGSDIGSFEPHQQAIPHKSPQSPPFVRPRPGKPAAACTTHSCESSSINASGRATGIVFPAPVSEKAAANRKRSFLIPSTFANVVQYVGALSGAVTEEVNLRIAAVAQKYYRLSSRLTQSAYRSRGVRLYDRVRLQVSTYHSGFTTIDGKPSRHESSVASSEVWSFSLSPLPVVVCSW